MGLRWWNDFDKRGNPVYLYESYEYDVVNSSMDTSVFWWGIGSNLVFWAIMFVVKTLGFQFQYVSFLRRFADDKMLLNLIATCLNWMNAYGYYQCRKTHQNKVANYFGSMKQEFGKKLLEHIF